MLIYIAVFPKITITLVSWTVLLYFLHKYSLNLLSLSHFLWVRDMLIISSFSIELRFNSEEFEHNSQLSRSQNKLMPDNDSAINRSELTSASRSDLTIIGASHAYTSIGHLFSSCLIPFRFSDEGEACVSCCLPSCCYPTYNKSYLCQVW